MTGLQTGYYVIIRIDIADCRGREGTTNLLLTAIRLGDVFYSDGQGILLCILSSISCVSSYLISDGRIPTGKEVGIV